jgi:hypothetical protein
VRIGPAVPFEVESVPGSAEILREVDLRASVTFSFEPRDGEPFTVARSLDGPMRLIRASDGDWSVLDFTRDAIPLSGQFQVVEGADAANGTAAVAVVVFFAAPIWQLGILVQAVEAVSFTPEDVMLVAADGQAEAAGAISTQLRHIRAGATVRGLVTFDARSDAEGLILRIAPDGSEGRAAIEIPLTGRIRPVQIQAPAASPTA